MSISHRPSIEVTGLVKTFGHLRALNGLDLHVPAGQVHGFLGPNGAGKSTTIRILLGMYRCDAGRVQVLGLDSARHAATITRRCAWCPVLVSLGVTQFGATLDLPERVSDANPLAQAGQVGSWWLLGTSTALICVSTVLLRHRDLAVAGPVRKARHRLTHRTASTY